MADARALSLILALLTTSAWAETIDGARVIVIDGDTVALPCASPSLGCAERLRLHAIDAPELRGARCEGEAALALAAKERLRALLAGPVEIERGEPSTGRARDRYRRTLGAIRRLYAAPGLPAGDVAVDLLARGLALRWAPGRSAKGARLRFWCGGKG